MRHLVLVLITMVLVSVANPAAAWPTFESGRFFGAVVQHGFDLDQDGSNGRGGSLFVRESKFGYLFVNIDTTLVDFTNPTVGCVGEGNFRIYASGELVLTSWSGQDVLYTWLDPSHSWCVLDGPEVAEALIVGGEGQFADATGSVEYLLPDDMVLNVDPGPLPFPRHVYVNDGEFTVFLD